MKPVSATPPGRQERVEPYIPMLPTDDSTTQFGWPIV